MKTEFQLGVIFDWDGVIVDSSHIHEASWERLAEEKGYTLRPGDFGKSFGCKNTEVIPHIFGWTQDPDEILRLGDLKEEHYRAIINEEGIEPLPGVIDLLNTLKEAEIPFGVGSSTSRENIELIIKKIGVNGYFTAITSAEDVHLGKPHPDVFLTAAKKIGIPPTACVVIEDAYVGLEAAKAAQMRSIAVATTHSLSELEGRADLVVENLTALFLADIKSIFQLPV